MLAPLFKRFQKVLQITHGAAGSPASGLPCTQNHFSEPGRVLEGMLVKADGTTWDPGSGAGVYVRDGGAWIKL